jgi:hypothetical protein
LQVEHHASFAEAWADLGTVRRFTGDFRGAADALQWVLMDPLLDFKDPVETTN